MSDLGDLMELLHTAHLRPKSLRGVVHHWMDNRLSREAIERLQRADDENSARGVLISTDTVGEGAAPAFDDTTYRLWGREPGRSWRFEWQDHGRDNVCILNDQHWWGNSFGTEYWTNVRPDGSLAGNVGGGMPGVALELMLDPRPLCSALDLRILGHGEHAGRRTIVASGRPGQQGRRGQVPMISFGWPYVDEVRILADEQEGILLSYEMLLDGRPFDRWEVKEIAFGEHLEDSLFIGPKDAQLPTFSRVVGGRRRRGTFWMRLKTAWMMLRGSGGWTE